MMVNKAAAIGKKALELIQSVEVLRVQGISTRGIFLGVEHEWILFLSREEFRGPLTINVPNLELNEIQIGNQVKVEHSAQWLDFQDVNRSVSYGAAQNYTPTIPVITPDFLWGRTWVKAREISNSVGVGSLNRDSGLGTGNIKLYEKIKQFLDALNAGDLGNSTHIAGEILGVGQGLTPEGDDFLIGFLFVLRIANSERNSDPKCDFLLSTITKIANQKTTTLSANLISCAAEGSVDERIGNFLDALFHVPENLDSAATELLGWGNTSGRMVLLGIVSGLEVIKGILKS